VNWGKITKYAVALFAAQVVLGFLEGFFSPAQESISTAAASLIGWSLVSFAAYAALFAHFTSHQQFKPFAHACLALLLEVALDAAIATLLSRVLPDWLGNVPQALMALEWFVLVCALVAGTFAGSKLRRAGVPADA
jgi:hypothetical protein